MLITFKSRAAGDVLMLGDVGKAMLRILGKDENARQGIVTVEQLPAAIAGLEAAFAASRAQPAIEPDEDDEDAPRGMAAPVSLAQRIVPLLALLKFAARDQQPVIWEAE